MLHRKGNTAEGRDKMLSLIPLIALAQMAGFGVATAVAAAGTAAAFALFGVLR